MQNLDDPWQGYCVYHDFRIRLVWLEIAYARSFWVVLGGYYPPKEK